MYSEFNVSWFSSAKGIAWLCDLYVPFSLYWRNFACPSMWKRKKWINDVLFGIWNKYAERPQAQSWAIPAAKILSMDIP